MADHLVGQPDVSVAGFGLADVVGDEISPPPALAGGDGRPAGNGHTGTGNGSRAGNGSPDGRGHLAAGNESSAGGESRADGKGLAADGGNLAKRGSDG